MRLLYIVWELNIKHGVNRMTNEITHAESFRDLELDAEIYIDGIKVVLNNLVENQQEDFYEALDTVQEYLGQVENADKGKFKLVRVFTNGTVRFKIGAYSNFHTASRSIKEIQDNVDQKFRVKKVRRPNVTRKLDYTAFDIVVVKNRIGDSS